MEVLRLFHYMNLQGKLTAFSFYRSLEYMTDSTGLDRPPVRAIILMIKALSNHVQFTGPSPCLRHDGSGVETHENVKTRW